MKCFITVIAGAALILGVHLPAQSTGEAPLVDLRLPVFNEFGNRIWDLRAASMRHLSPRAERLELTNIHLLILEGDPNGTVEAELFAPVAVVDQVARTVSGTGQLHVIGRGVELFGHDWICHADAKSIVIERDVVVTFSADIGSILR